MNAISIIISVYNVEKYIIKCLSSIVNQSFKDFNLIIVDDCGKDNSINLAKDFLNGKNIKYKIINNKINQGVSESRNIAIASSESDYIVFIDPDDWVEHTFLEMLYKAGRDFNSDIVSCNGIEFWEIDGLVTRIPTIAKGRYNSAIFLKHLFNGETTAHLCWRLYKRSLFKDIKFPKGVVFEDYLVLPLLVEKATFVIQIEETLYYYLQRHANENITRSRLKNVSGFIRQMKQFDLYFINKSKIVDKKFVIKYEYMLLSYVLAKILKSALKFNEAKNDVKMITGHITYANLILITSISNRKNWFLLFLTKFNGSLIFSVMKRRATILRLT